MAMTEHQRWLNAAAEYVRLREELKQMQAEMDAVRATLGECVEPPKYKEQAILVQDSQVIVVVEQQHVGGEIAVHVKPAIA